MEIRPHILVLLGSYKRLLLLLALSLHAFAWASPVRTYLGSREGHPASLVHDVSVIYGDYTVLESDLALSGPEPFELMRYYSSRDDASTAPLGGWRFCPHCYLTLKHIKGKKRGAPHLYAYVGTERGSILTYVGAQNGAGFPLVLTPDIEGAMRGLCSSKASVEPFDWSNLAHTRLTFSPDGSSCTWQQLYHLEAKRVYRRHATDDSYLLAYEIRPSGCRITYSYDAQDRLVRAEIKDLLGEVVNWVAISYGPVVRATSGDGQKVEYRFSREAFTERALLVSATHSHKPSLQYAYRFHGPHALMIERESGDGHHTAIDYYEEGDEAGKVCSLCIAKEGKSDTAARFSYQMNEGGSGTTAVHTSAHQCTAYQFNARQQLTARNSYDKDTLYLSDLFLWGCGGEATSLVERQVLKADGTTSYAETIAYNDLGEPVEVHSYRSSGPGIILDPKGHPLPGQGEEVMTYIYAVGVDEQTFTIQAGAKEIQFTFRRGTTQLLRALLVENGVCEEERHFLYTPGGSLLDVVTGEGGGRQGESIE